MIHVRPLTDADREHWEPLWLGFQEHYGRVGADALPTEVTETTWQRFHDPDEPIRGLVAELDGRVVGIAHVIFRRSTSSVADVCYLQDLFTAEDARGQGVGRALIHAAHALAVEAGAPGVYWQTRDSNEQAQVLYDTVGEPHRVLVYRTQVD